MADVSLEQQIMEQVHRLSREQQEQVLNYIHWISQPKMTWKEWLARVEVFQAELRAKYGEDFVVGSQALLEEAREERLNDLLGGG